MYSLESFIRYIGNPLDDTRTTNVLYFDHGKCVSIGVSNPRDIKPAEDFIRKVDGLFQIYLNINPANHGVTGKPKETDIPEVKNLYIDIDAIKPDENRKNPATPEEIEDIPTQEILRALSGKYRQFYSDHTGNGLRAIIPVDGATKDDQRELVSFMHAMFPEYIDRSVKDASRVTGVPGTWNKKVGAPNRPNRRREHFPNVFARMTNQPTTYTEQEKTKTPSLGRNSQDSPIGAKRRTTGEVPAPTGETAEQLKTYLLSINSGSPHIMELLTHGVPIDLGFMYDSFFAAEVIGKIGNAPRCYAMIMKRAWNKDYNARMTEDVWDRTVSSGVAPWSTATFRRVFGNSYFGDNHDK